MKTLIIILAVLSFGSVFSADSTKINDGILSEEEYIGIVKNYHPIAIQANNVVKQGESLVRNARGYFDPKLYANHLDKNFQTKNYYDLTDIGLKIPTWFGIELKTGWEYAFGTFTNPEHTTPTDGLFYSGISFSPNQLIIDKRKSILLKAKEYNQMSLHNQNELLNDLFKNALYEYWNWSAQYEKKKVLEQTLSNIETRMSNARRLFEYGELSVLDTLETFTQLQAVHVELLNTQLKYQKATLSINNYLWGENLVPLEIDGQKPEAINPKKFQSSPEQKEQLLAEHPTLNAYKHKLNALKIDQRLQAQNLAPQLELQYNLLSNDGLNNPNTYSTNNYKWGFNFSMPIFLRKERGQLQLAKIATNQQELKLKLKEQTLSTKAESYLVMIDNLKKQEKIYSEAVKGYSTLLRQEKSKVENGEGTFFKLTIRENKFFNSQLKYIDIQLKLIKSHLSYTHTLGQFYNL